MRERYRVGKGGEEEGEGRSMNLYRVESGGVHGAEED